MDNKTLREKLVKNPRFKELKSGNAYIFVPFRATDMSPEDEQRDDAKNKNGRPVEK